MDKIPMRSKNLVIAAMSFAGTLFALNVTYFTVTGFASENGESVPEDLPSLKNLPEMSQIA